jgi:hypothetical protein
MRHGRPQTHRVRRSGARAPPGAAPNAKVIRKHKTKEIVAIILEPFGDDSRIHTRDTNPQKLSHNAETADNPRRVWTFKKLEPPLSSPRP